MVNALFLALPGGVIEKVEHYSLAWFILIFPKKNYNTESIHITRHTAHTYFLKQSLTVRIQRRKVGTDAVKCYRNDS